MESLMRATTIQERLGWNITPELHERIRRLWIKHSKAEDQRDLDGLIQTLSADCVYEIVLTGQRWEGHEGARQFYTSFLEAFPDVKFSLAEIVIGPQGVFEVAEMTGTHRGAWLGVQPSGNVVRATVIILFPWNPESGKFAGEKIFVSPEAFGGESDRKAPT
jgi:predicted ester cyclase